MLYLVLSYFVMLIKEGILMKNRFYGKYYKFISDNNYVLAFITSHTNEGDMIQIINGSGSYFINDMNAIKIDNNIITFNVNSDNITISGKLELSNLSSLKSKVMGPFHYLPLECKHQIYSMKHNINGILLINNKEYKYTNSLGYIEGDSGISFPKKYIWYNSINNTTTVTMAIASVVVMGFIKFKGLLCFIKDNNKEYKLCTYNFGKVIKIENNTIIIKRGKYKFILEYDDIKGHNLKAPVNGNMDRFIKEAITIKTRYKLLYKNNIILDNIDNISSLEYMWD